MQIYDKISFIPNHFINVTQKKLSAHIPPHGHDFFEIEFILNGKGTHLIDGVSYPIVKTASELTSALSSGKKIMLANDIALTGASQITIKAGTLLDGNGYTITYSVETYAARMIDTENPTLAALIRAMMQLGDTVKTVVAG